MVQNFLEAVKDENNTLLKREDFSENFYEMYHSILTQTLSLYWIIKIWCYLTILIYLFGLCFYN